ncbi:MAG: hypothetical protein IJV00_05915 [Clostridia bacterium]|nr:hypothetical protein [Clostridia bacterium]
MIFPVADIGSNTVKLAVYDSESQDRFSPFIFKSLRLSLITKRISGYLDRDAVWTLANTMEQFGLKLALKGITEPINAFATASLRGLKNSDQVLESVYRHSGVKIKILTSSEEAGFSYRGVCVRENVPDALVVDMGGGSTEFMISPDTEPENFRSFDFGFISLMEKYCELGANGLKEHLDRILGDVGFIKDCHTDLFLAGGSAKALAETKKMMYGGGSRLESEQLLTLLRDLSQADEKTLERLESLVGERRDSLPAVIVFFYCVMCAAGKSSATVSSGGVREGFVFELMKKSGAL